MRSKVNLGHPKWQTAATLSKFSKTFKLRIYLKWPDMRSKVNFGHPKWPTATILSKISKKKFSIDLKWPEMRSKVNFGSKMSPGGHFVKRNSKKECIPHLSEIARNAFKSEFRTSKMGAGGHFVKYFEKNVLYWSEMARNEFWTSKWPPAAIL